MKKQLLIIATMLIPTMAIADASGECGENVTWTYTEATHELLIEGTGPMADYSSSPKCPWSDLEVVTAVIGPNVTTIGHSAFLRCKSLVSVTIGNSVTSIGGGAFEECTNLTTINIPNSVNNIDNFAFADCRSLTSIIIPNNVTNIGDCAFQSCSDLTSITIPNSVTSIGNSVFAGCSGLTSIIVDAENTVYDSRTNCNAIIESSTNTLLVGCKTSTIPNSVTSIGLSAFNGCSDLTSITIPNSVTSIGNLAFSGSGLNSITIPYNVTKISDSAFNGCNELASMIVDADNWVYDSRMNCNAIIESSTNTLIAGCKTSIIPDNVTTIGKSAFYGCRSLTYITIPNSVINIGPNAFYYTGLTSITIPNCVTTIERTAFRRCTDLTSIIISSSVTNIGRYAFDGCENLSTIIVDKGNTVYDSRNNCNAIIETASNTILYGCKNTVILNSVTTIGDNAFGDCIGLTSITIPNSVTNIGNNAFRNCSGLTSVIIPNSVTSIGDFAFDGCSLTSVTLGKSIANIGSYAFEGNSSLRNVYCYAEQIPVAGTSFICTNILSSSTLHVPATALSLYQETSPWKNFGSIVALTDEDPNPNNINDVRCAEGIVNTPIYDFGGRRLIAPQKGVNIISGKKVLIK